MTTNSRQQHLRITSNSTKCYVRSSSQAAKWMTTAVEERRVDMQRSGRDKIGEAEIMRRMLREVAAVRDQEAKTQMTATSN